MSTTFFRQIGPYEIQHPIGRGGMGHVFLARDTRPGGSLVALKIVPDGPDPDARETAAAEQRGAELLRAFLPTSAFVPRVYDVDHADGYLYIAMEYVEGEDLSTIIKRGPLEPRRAATIAVQLCQFLEEIDRLESSTAGASPLTLLHNDLKPTNVRLTANDEVKVLDFGAAKPLSMSRRATRNDFYSTPYLSPECLETGERDRQADAWALGAILFEMIAGRPAFRADSTRRLEALILSRTPPDAPDDTPHPLRAVIAKLLAPSPQDRYGVATAIREDLDRFLSGQPTTAEAQGWPRGSDDEPPTRRIRQDHAGEDDEPATRRTPAPSTPDAVLPALPPPLPPPIPAAPDARTGPPNGGPNALTSFERPRRRVRRRWVIGVLFAAMCLAVANESCLSGKAERLAATVPAQEFTSLPALWDEYDTLTRRSWFNGAGARPLRKALVDQTHVLADRVVDSYRMSASTVWSKQWSTAADALLRASIAAPGDDELRGTLRYVQGHLHRIDGETRKREGETAQAEREFARAVTAFREAARLRRDWPDPFLGLARTFIYGVDDIDRGADAIKQAQRLGHTLGHRETAQLAYGYGIRGGVHEHTASKLEGMPQEREYLTRARDDYRKALELYTDIATYGDVPRQMRLMQLRLERAEQKLDEMD